jgi:hypothetical protein
MVELGARLLERPCIGIETAGQLLVTAGDHPERLRSEAAWAMLCGTSPLPASSGKTNRHRLNRGGDRQANLALHMIAISRLRTDKNTQAFVGRKIAEGKSKLEAIRVPKAVPGPRDLPAPQNYGVGRGRTPLNNGPAQDRRCVHRALARLDRWGLDKHENFWGAAYTSLVFSRRVAELELDQSFGTTGVLRQRRSGIVLCHSEARARLDTRHRTLGYPSGPTPGALRLHRGLLQLPAHPEPPRLPQRNRL